MSLPNIAMWGAAAGASAWKGSQLARVPGDRGLRVITLCTSLVFIALSAQLAAGAEGLFQTVPSQLPKLFQNVVLTFFFALLIILLQSLADPSATASRGLGEIAVALAASGGLTAVFMAAGPRTGDFSYETAGYASGPLLFYLVGNSYMAYATARGAQLAWRAAEQTQSRARLSLRVAAAGLVVCCLGTHLPRVASTFSRVAFDEDAVPGTAGWTTSLLATGIGVFFLGVAYPGVRTGLVKAHLWFEDRKRYRLLWPLWSALYKAFPHIALLPSSNHTRDSLRVRHMRLHYYRRIIECRDGLVCLSPYVGAKGASASRIRTALARSTDGKPNGAVSVIAAPSEAGMEADIRQLLTLSQSLAKSATP